SASSSRMVCFARRSEWRRAGACAIAPSPPCGERATPNVQQQKWVRGLSEILDRPLTHSNRLPHLLALSPQGGEGEATRSALAAPSEHQSTLGGVPVRSSTMQQLEIQPD